MIIDINDPRGSGVRPIETKDIRESVMLRMARNARRLGQSPHEISERYGIPLSDVAAMPVDEPPLVEAPVVAALPPSKAMMLAGVRDVAMMLLQQADSMRQRAISDMLLKGHGPEWLAQIEAWAEKLRAVLQTPDGADVPELPAKPQYRAP